MCTLTVIPVDTTLGYRLVTNRDENRRRPAALAPAAQRSGDRHWVWPVDPVGGGTWVGVGEHGVSLSILNVNLVPSPEMPGSDELTSRGLIIPRLASCATALEAADAADRLDVERFAPFRLVIADRTHLCEAVWNRRALVVARAAMGPACFVSHGMGDGLAAPRLELWRAFLSRGVSPSMQDEFHAHQWPDQPEISVMMDREDARTVSVTAIEADESGVVVMDYRTDDANVRRAVGRASARTDAGPSPRVRVAGPVRC